MDYRTLGNSGCAVSTYCLGTMTFGAETSEADSHVQLDHFVEAGGTLVDTADVYSAGVSEEIIGRWAADRPSDVTERVVLATKGRFPMGDEPNSAGLSARHLTRALDASLRRLGVDSVDLYQVHASDPYTPLEETLRTLDGFIRAGKIRYYGLSNFTGWQLTKLVGIAKAINVSPPVTLQPQYSLIVREIEWEIVPAAIDAGLGLLPWSPLGGGWLSGKYRRDSRPTGATRLGEDPNRGMEAWERRGTDRTWRIIDAVEKVADNRGVSMAEVALAWVTARPGVTSTILGARTVEQLQTNLKAADLHLSDAETADLDEASDLGASDYPYGTMGSNSVRGAWRADMQFGLDVNQQRMSFDEVVTRTRLAEDLGFTGAWGFDHLQPMYGEGPGECFEGMTTLAALSGITTTIRLGLLVTGVTYRHPSVLAAEAITVDHASHGRFDFALGAAWAQPEHDQLGIPFPSTGQRFDLLEDTCEIVTRLFTGEQVSYEGKRISLTGAQMRPVPVQRPHPPIWIGGSGPKRTLPIVARYADVWHTHAGDDYPALAERLAGLAAQAGRDPGDIRRASSLSLSESLDEAEASIESAIAQGFDYLVCGWPGQGAERVAEFAQQVLPKYDG